MTAFDAAPVLSRHAALDVLAFLITAARTQSEEAAEYGPMRLLMAARLLAANLTLGDGADAMSALVRDVANLEPVRTPSRDRDAYLAALDELCARVADVLVAEAKR